MVSTDDTSPWYHTRRLMSFVACVQGHFYVPWFCSEYVPAPRADAVSTMVAAKSDDKNVSDDVEEVEEVVVLSDAVAKAQAKVEAAEAVIASQAEELDRLKQEAEVTV